MAEQTLAPITNRRQAPFAFTNHTIAGTEQLNIRAGYYYDVPCVWELIAIRFTLTTDATVANRKPTVKLLPDNVYTLQQAISDNIAASTTETVYIAKVGWESEAASGRFLGINDKAWCIYGDGRVNFSTDTGKAGDVAVIRTQWRWLNWDLGMELPEAVGAALKKAGIVK